MKRYSKVEDYFNTKMTSYISLLKSSKKWEELIWETESKASFVITGISTVAFYLGFGTQLGTDVNNLMRDISLNLAMTLIGLLGFLISGLAIFTGTITNKLIKDIDSDNKGADIISIFYSFYFIGGIDVVEIIIFVIIYFLSFVQKPFCVPITYIVFIITTYLFVFILLYSVSLLGTCIRVFLVSYKYHLEDSKNKN